MQAIIGWLHDGAMHYYMTGLGLDCCRVATSITRVRTLLS
jgi:hypothetical protein